MTIKQIKDGLHFTIDMFLFDPSTGEYKDKEQLNDMDRITYDACEGAIKALEELQAHREAWGKITAEIQDRSFENPMMNPIFTMNEIYEIIDKYRPKE